MEKVRIFLRKMFNLIKQPQMRVLPGQLAFFFILSFIPLLVIVANIISYFGLSLNTIREAIASSLPGDIAGTMVDFVSGKGLSWNIVAFLIMALILASNGAHSIIITSNEIYKVEDKGIVKRRLKAILMTIMLVGLLFFLLVVPVCGKLIFTLVKESATNQEFVSMVYGIYNVLKYPLSIILIYFIVKVLYTIAPDQKIESHTTVIGSLFTAILWAIATSIFSFYVEKFAYYDLLYGSISNLIILFIWVYILAYIFVLGLIINASNANEKDLKAQIVKAFRNNNNNQ